MVEIKYINFIDYTCPTIVKCHIHDCYELVYYHSGEGQVFYDQIGDNSSLDKTIRATKQEGDDNFLKERISYLNKQNGGAEGKDFFKANTFYLIPAYMPHAEIHVKAPTITAIGFTASDYHFQKIKYFDDFSSIHALLMRIKNEYSRKQYHFIESIQHLLSIILIETERKDTNNKEDPLEYAKNYIDQYYMTDINFQNLASICGYCPDYFRMIFRQKYGIPPKQYMSNYRLQFAKSQLSNLSLSIEEVSDNCGFRSYKQFFDFFKKKTGVSPTLYRSTLQNS